MESKVIWTSKTFWVNTLAFGYGIYQMITGNQAPLNPELQVAILSAINWLLRIITKSAVKWR